MNSDYPRDLIGYGPTPPHAKWPDNARIAVQFVLNYEEGGENNVLHGDEHSEQSECECKTLQQLKNLANCAGCFRFLFWN